MKLRAFEVVHMIAGSHVRVCEKAENDILPGVAAFHYIPMGTSSVVYDIRLASPCGTDAESIAAAAHEAFHALRCIEGVQYYHAHMHTQPFLSTLEEEKTVNQLAREFLSSILSAEEMPVAEAMLYYGETTYVDVFYQLLHRQLMDENQIGG
jgi:hypothetical protein